MTISIFLDSNALNFLFEQAFDLIVELPPDEFSIFINRQVEIELMEIPNVSKKGVSKMQLKQYIRDSIECRQVKTTAIFGFAEANSSSGKHRYGGFGSGTFQSENDRAWYQRGETKKFLHNEKVCGSGLIHNEADVSVAVCSFNSVVLTTDKKNGPISDAAKHGGKVIYLNDFDQQPLSLKMYILEKMSD